jgi:hypothetical protein
MRAGSVKATGRIHGTGEHSQNSLMLRQRWDNGPNETR